MSTGNTAEPQIEERISDIKDRNLEMMQREEDTDLSIKNKQQKNWKLYDNYLTPSEKSNIRIVGIPEEKEREGNGEPIQTDSLMRTSKPIERARSSNPRIKPKHLNTSIQKAFSNTHKKTKKF